MANAKQMREECVSITGWMVTAGMFILCCVCSYQGLIAREEDEKKGRARPNLPAKASLFFPALSFSLSLSSRNPELGANPKNIIWGPSVTFDAVRLVRSRPIVAAFDGLATAFLVDRRQ